jgi:LysR family glycine cleavage system transcriptional activator
MKYHEHEQWTEVVSTDIALSAVVRGHGFTLAAEYLFSQYLEAGL